MKKKSTALGIGIIGGAMGGLVSALISSPQTQLAFWHKEPSNRANIIFWDFVAFFAVVLLLGILWKKRGLIYGSFVILGAGIGVGLYAREKWGGLKENNSEYPQDWPGRELYLP